MARVKRYHNKKSIAKIIEIPVIHFWKEWEIMNYIIEYIDWDCECIKLRRDEYRGRALMQGLKSMNDELNVLSYEYEKYIREVENIKDCKRGEYILTKTYYKYDENKKRCWTWVSHIAIKPSKLLQYRLNLYDIVWRLVSSSPHYSKCWDWWFKSEDLHTSLFIEADEIMCSTFCPRERRVSMIYYLTHFINSNTPIRNAFKIDKEFDNTIDNDVIGTEIDNPNYWWIEDYYKNGIIDEVEMKIMDMLCNGHKIWNIAKNVWIKQAEVKERIEDIKEKIKVFMM